MKNLNFMVPNNQHFNLSDELFQIELINLQKIIALGPVINRFMSAMQAIVYIAMNLNFKLPKLYSLIRCILSSEINIQHKKIMEVHTQS